MGAISWRPERAHSSATGLCSRGISRWLPAPVQPPSSLLPGIFATDQCVNTYVGDMGAGGPGRQLLGDKVGRKRDLRGQFFPILLCFLP